jgi:peptidoglycan hydrolase-like protein with peptidoglycan-binding domain
LITLLLLSSIPGLAYASTVLKTGSRGSEVAGMQQRLINLGYLSGRADGIFGPATAGAVKNFQRVNGLTVDGIAGPNTLNALYGANAKPAGSSTPSGGGSGNTGSTTPPAVSTGTTPIQRVLRRGDRGSDVAALQNRLNALKYNAGTPDGIFGAATENAVRTFQRAKGLTADGIVGSKTISALFTGAATPPAGNPGTSTPGTGTQNPPSGGGGAVNPITTVLRKGSMGSQVKALQNRLNQLGYNCGAADGIFGQGTYNAVVNFQRANNLAADGIVGPATASRLFSVQSGSGSSPNPPPVNPDPIPENPVPGSLKGKVVIIDPGHGGVDSGAYHGGLKEANLALDMGLRLRTILEKAGATVYMTRSDDRYVSLYYRSAFANKVVLDMEIQSVNAQKEQAVKAIAEKQAGISALPADKTALAAYREALIQLNDALNLLNSASVQWVIKDLSPEMQLILESKINTIKEGFAVLGLQYENRTLDDLTAALNEYTGEKQELKASLLTDVAQVAEMAGTTQTIADIEKEISDRNNAADSLSEKIALAEELRASLRQQLKDQIYLGSTVLAQENLSELEQMIASVDQAVLQIDTEGDKLQQEINALNSSIAGYNSSLAELQRLLNGFSAYFSNPSYNNRTGIYSVIPSGTRNIASNDLKKVMDLTREKYQDKIVFIAIHLNATNTTQTTASGMYTFYRDNQPDSYNNADYYENYNSAARIKFASKLLQETTNATSFSKKQTAPHNDDFSVLRENNVVSSLVEVGFMTNPSDLSLVAQPSYREKVAYGMFRGISEYFK